MNWHKREIARDAGVVEARMAPGESASRGDPVATSDRGLTRAHLEHGRAVMGEPWIARDLAMAGTSYKSLNKMTGKGGLAIAKFVSRATRSVDEQLDLDVSKGLRYGPRGSGMAPVGKELAEQALGGDIAAFSPVITDPPYSMLKKYEFPGGTTKRVVGHAAPGSRFKKSREEIWDLVVKKMRDLPSHVMAATRHEEAIDTSHVPMAPLDPSGSADDRASKINRTTRKALLNSAWGLMTSSRGIGTLPAILTSGKIHDPGTVLDAFAGSGTTGAAARDISEGEFVNELYRLFSLPGGEREPALRDYLLAIPESASESIKVCARAMMRKMAETWWGPVRMKVNLPDPDAPQAIDPAKAAAWLRSQMKSALPPIGTRRTPIG